MRGMSKSKLSMRGMRSLGGGAGTITVIIEYCKEFMVCEVCAV